MNKFLVLISIVVYVECNGYAGLISQAPISNAGGYGYGSSQPVQYYQPQQQQQIVEVQNENTPIKVLFRARSPKIQVEQYNVPADKQPVQRTRTEEEPHRVEHEVFRPVIQEIREIIQPYRRIVQEIQPVIEQVSTAVARGEGRANNGGAGQLALGPQLAPQQLQLAPQQVSYGQEELRLAPQQASYGQEELRLAPQQVSYGQEELRLAPQNGYLGQEQILLNNGNNGKAEYRTSILHDYQGSKLSNIGYQSPLWLNAKDSSRGSY